MDRLLVTFLMLTPVLSMDNLRVAFEWNILDFDFPSEEIRGERIANKEFIPENNLPLGLEVSGDRLFITVPRWKSGVPASLTYINLSDSNPSPKLKPYPNWEAHDLSKDPEIVSPFRIRADQCGRLWVLDTGVSNILSPTGMKEIRSNHLLIYDLHNDALIRKYALPKGQYHENSFFANIAVEDHDCQNSYAYLGDLAHPGLVVYSWKSNNSWRVKHHFFNMDPLAGSYNISGITFNWQDGLFGLALSNPDNEGYSTLYFHPLNSFNEFAVSTKTLREEKDEYPYKDFRLLGSRGPKSQSGASFLDKKTNVLFYALISLNAVACWRTTIPTYTMESQGRIFMSNVSMVFPNDIKVDSNDNLWVLSDRLPRFMYRSLDYNDVNFRILTAKVQDAIRGTACDSKLVIKPKTTTPTPRTHSSGSTVSYTSLALLSVLFFAIFRL